MLKNQEERKPKMVIMCGLPKSGKSTIVNRELREYQVICGDDIRLALGVEFDPRLEDFVWGTFNTMVRASLIRGLDVVLDGTHTTRFRRERVINLGREYEADITIFFVKTPYETCIKRAIESDFPVDVMERMQASLELEPPTKEEGVEIVERSVEIVHGAVVITEYINR
jgi:predicted kinase